ncbi:MAG: ribose-5-phosphate isomerase RpiA [Rubricoccaceae bacterium]|nr:ribose-5-phosphate isomerase RpiA [Rubricoccaceae bacterium]
MTTTDPGAPRGPLPESPADDAKRAAGEAAAALAEDGMRLGLGTGSTTAFALAALGRRVRDEGLRIVGVPTSFAAERLARQHGVPLATLDALGLGALAPGEAALDLALDGADEVSPALDLIKGRGAAHTREKVVAALAARFVVLIDPSKEVEQLGTAMPVPVEVLPFAEPAVSRALRGLGAEPVLRMGKAKDGPVVTDQGFWILDARFPSIAEPGALAATLASLPGILDHGLFVGLATDVLVGTADGAVRRMSR